MQLGHGTRVLKVLVHTYRTDGIVKGLYRCSTLNAIHYTIHIIEEHREHRINLEN